MDPNWLQSRLVLQSYKEIIYSVPTYSRQRYGVPIYSRQRQCPNINIDIQIYMVSQNTLDLSIYISVPTYPRLSYIYSVPIYHRLFINRYIQCPNIPQIIHIYRYSVPIYSRFIYIYILFKELQLLRIVIKDVKHYVQYNSFFNKNVKLKTEIYIQCPNILQIYLYIQCSNIPQIIYIYRYSVQHTQDYLYIQIQCPNIPQIIFIQIQCPNIHQIIFIYRYSVPIYPRLFIYIYIYFFKIPWI